MADQDLRPTEEIVAEALRLVPVKDDDDQGHDYWNCVRCLHERGGQPEFELANDLLQGADSNGRVLGADILGQLRSGGSPTFIDESVELLVSALNDPNAEVIESAAYSLGHRKSPLAIEALLLLVDHSPVEMRRAVVHGLSCLDDRRATDALIRLCSDEDAYVVDWASFGLAEQCIIDYPELRRLLHSLLGDANPEIRGQALIGLSRRGDKSCMDALRAELRGKFNGIWAAEAAGYFGDPALVDDLLFCRTQMKGEPDYLIELVDEAIEACRNSMPAEP
ncbi:MAG: HEAT repeat domain-containing protein [Hyphomicrobiaceae bacterium]